MNLNMEELLFWLLQMWPPEVDVEDVKFIINFNYPNSSEIIFIKLEEHSQYQNRHSIHLHNIKQVSDLILCAPWS